MDDVNELYRQTKIAQERAERHGFPGTAAALAGIAVILAGQGVDPKVVEEVAALTGTRSAVAAG